MDDALAFPWVLVTERSLDAGPIRKVLSNPKTGALVIFEGVARDHYEGQEVLELAYEAFAPMAEKELMELRQQALHQFSLTGCAIHHRLGIVPLQEAAVIIGTSSGHRSQAFQAAIWIMDEIKKHVPIWKRERYCDGREAWVETQERFETAGEKEAPFKDS